MKNQPQSVFMVLGLFAVLFPGLFLGGCQKAAPEFDCKDPIGCVRLAADEPLKIGVLQALSGSVATLGKEQIRGLELALDERRGKVANHTVLLQIEDTGCTPHGGANAVLKIIADPKFVAVFGTTCSGAAATASRAMSAAGLTMVSGNNSSPFLTSIADQRAPNFQKGYFRTSNNEESSGKAAAIYAYEKLGIRRVATINDGDIYTKGLTDGFNSAFKNLGGQVVSDTAVNKGDTQMEPVLSAVLNVRAQLLFLPLFQPEASQILLQAKEMRQFKDIALMGGGALINRAFLDAVGQKGHGMFFVGPASYTGKQVKQMEKKYRQKYKTAPAVFYFLNAYDAANILFDGIEKASVMCPDGLMHIGRKRLRTALYETKNYKGVTGTISCDPFGDCAVPVFNILQLEDIEKGIEGLKSNVKFIYTPKK